MRRIDDGFNIFKGSHIIPLMIIKPDNNNNIGLFGNYLFSLIVLIISACQVIFVIFGGKALACSPHGLSLAQWGICLAVGAFGLVINFLLKLIPYPKKPPKKEVKSNLLHPLILQKQNRIIRKQSSIRSDLSLDIKKDGGKFRIILKQYSNDRIFIDAHEKLLSEHEN